MHLERQKQQKVLIQSLKEEHTHPGIIKGMVNIIKQEWTSETNLEDHMSGKDEITLRNVIRQQMQLKHASLEKWFLCKEWSKTQDE